MLCCRDARDGQAPAVRVRTPLNSVWGTPSLAPAEVRSEADDFEQCWDKLRNLHVQECSRLRAQLQEMRLRAEQDDIAAEGTALPSRVSLSDLDEVSPEVMAEKFEGEAEVEIELPPNRLSYTQILSSQEALPTITEEESQKEALSPEEKGRQSQIHLAEKIEVLGKELKKVRSMNLLKVDRSQLSLSYLVQHPLFNALTAFMIVFNAVQIGYDAELSAAGKTPGILVQLWSFVCTIYFAVECALRIRVFRWAFFYGEAWTWNWFDLLLVVCSAADLVPLLSGSEDSSIVLSAIRALKMLRIIRVFRVFRVIKQLSNLMVMIADSLSSLLWAMVMLVIIMYVFAIGIMNFTSDWAHGQSDSSAVARVTGYFGSLDVSFYTLAIVMLGGVDFAEVLADLMLVGWVPFTLLMFFVLFTNLAVLNVVTGVFVDRALEAEKSQREYQVERVLKAQVLFNKQIVALLAQIDSNSDGRISRDELHAMLEDDKLKAHWETLGLTDFNKTKQADRLFDLLDENGDGAIYVDEFLDKCGLMRGPASALELLAVQTECGHIRRYLSQLIAGKANPNGADQQ